MKSKLVVAMMAGAVLAVLSVGLAVATVITVDGNTTDWPGEPGPCTIGPGCAWLTTDPDEQPDDVTGIRNQYDIEMIWFTNSSTTAYWRLDSYAPMDFTRDLEAIDICIDTDNNLDNNYDDGTCNSIGAERMVRLTYIAGIGGVANARSCTVSGCATILGPATYAIGSHAVEIGVPIATLGLQNGTTYRMAIYFDNRDSDNDDHIPDSSYITFTVGCGAPGNECSPTAINLASLSATSGSTISSNSNSALPLVALGAVSVAVLATTVAFQLRRRRAQG